MLLFGLGSCSRFTTPATACRLFSAMNAFPATLCHRALTLRLPLPCIMTL